MIFFLIPLLKPNLYVEQYSNSAQEKRKKININQIFSFLIEKSHMNFLKKLSSETH